MELRQSTEWLSWVLNAYEIKNTSNMGFLKGWQLPTGLLGTRTVEGLGVDSDLFSAAACSYLFGTNVKIP